ncbi:hypothetical protein SteCoe_15604 [Stentor coeruleus]|uniref:Uncharacterized protein n=1 Tax=Stentor coeruleus TaxID=5963 RepID=A0A1R2C332_9CILI|nr:hypothetical protein SteCoe_15604 [Stentor coeruleus]
MDYIHQNRGKVSGIDSENKIDDEALQEKLCRICFEHENESNPVICPCRCNGTMKYIHEECLKSWIISQSRDLYEFSCDICKATLDMEFRYKTVLSCKNFEDECLKIVIFPFIIFLVCTVFGIIVAYTAKGVVKDKLSLSEKIYLSIVIATCVIMILVLLIIFIKSIRAGCCTRKMASWKIKPYHITEERDRTIITENISKENQSPVTAAEIIPFEGPQLDLNQSTEDPKLFIRRNTEEINGIFRLHRVSFDDDYDDNNDHPSLRLPHEVHDVHEV